MKNRKIVCILLLVSILLGTVSCSEEPNRESKAAETVASETLQTPAAEESEEIGYPKPDFSGLDFGGDNLSVITPNFHFYSYYIADELTGESVNDAVYYRNVNTEEALNVDVTVNQEYSDSQTHNVVISSVMAGDDAWHIVYTHSIYGIDSYVLGDYLYDMSSLPYVNFEAPWWEKESIEYFTIGDEVYYGRGDLVLTTTEVMLFNKGIAKDYSMSDHYDLVREGDWTLDTFIENACKVSEDLNGDGVMNYEDKVGLTGDMNERLVGFPFSFDIQLTATTSNGLEFVFFDEKYIEIFEKTYDFITNPNVSQAYFRTQTPENERLIFSSGNALYTMVDGAEIALLRDAEVDFGVLPMPKYDEQQEKYRCYAWPTFVCVPKSIRNVEKVGAGLECFAYESQPVMEAYMMDLLRGKSVRDEDSVEMLNIIYNSQVIDIAPSYLGFNGVVGKLVYMYSNLIQKKNENIVSECEKAIKPSTKVLTKLYETILENQAGH